MELFHQFHFLELRNVYAFTYYLCSRMWDYAIQSMRILLYRLGRGLIIHTLYKVCSFLHLTSLSRLRIEKAVIRILLHVIDCT